MDSFWSEGAGFLPKFYHFLNLNSCPMPVHQVSTSTHHCCSLRLERESKRILLCSFKTYMPLNTGFELHSKFKPLPVIWQLIPKAIPEDTDVSLRLWCQVWHLWLLLLCAAYMEQLLTTLLVLLSSPSDHKVTSWQLKCGQIMMIWW